MSDGDAMAASFFIFVFCLAAVILCLTGSVAYAVGAAFATIGAFFFLAFLVLILF